MVGIRMGKKGGRGRVGCLVRLVSFGMMWGVGVIGEMEILDSSYSKFF